MLLNSKNIENDLLQNYNKSNQIKSNQINIYFKNINNEIKDLLNNYAFNQFKYHSNLVDFYECRI